MKLITKLILGTALLANMSAPGATYAQHFVPPPVDRVVPILPTDVTNIQRFTSPMLLPKNMPQLDERSAVKRLRESSFPPFSEAKDESSGLIVIPKAGSDAVRSSNTCMQLTEGSVFVSVRKPSNMFFVVTPHGTVCLNVECEAVITFDDGLLRVLNLTAFNERVKVMIHQAAVSGVINGKAYGDASTEGIVVAVKYGHELLAADRPLAQADLRPADAIARRRSVLFENDRMGVSEFSLTSALQGNDFLQTVIKNASSKEELKIVKDLAKMAAVLDYVHPEGGYVARDKKLHY